MPTAHASKHGIRSALQRHVQVRRQTAIGVLQEVQEEVVDLRGLDATQSEASRRYPLQELGAEPGQRGGVGQVPPVVPDVDAGDDQLGVGVGQEAGLGHHLIDAPGAGRSPGQARGAERALPVASVLDLQPSPGGAPPAPKQLSTDGLGVHPVQGGPELDLGQRRCRETCPGSSHLHRGPDLYRIVTLDDVDDAGHGAIRLGLEGRGAPGHHDARVGPLPTKSPDEASGVGVGLVRHRAGVHDEEVGILPLMGRATPSCFRLLPHPLGVVLVRLAAEGVIVYPHVVAPPGLRVRNPRPGRRWWPARSSRRCQDSTVGLAPPPGPPRPASRRWLG